MMRQPLRHLCVLGLVIAVGCVGLAPVASAAGTATLQGTVTTTGGAPVAGATVAVFSTVFGNLLGQGPTDGVGHYAVAGLPAGQVRVQFVATGFPTQWNGGAPSFKTAANVTAVAGTSVTRDQVLAHAGSIDATITTANGTPLSGMVAVASPATVGEVLTGTSSSPSGQLALSLPASTYKVLVYDPAISSGSGYLPQFDSASVFSTIPGIDAAFAAATPIVVAEGATVPRSFILTTPNCTPSQYFPSANLSGQDLAGTDLSGCNLAGADLRNANLTSADLTGARLTGADLRGASVGLVSWAGAICPDGSSADANGSTCFGHLGASTTLTVDSSLDQPDLQPGDGLCWSATGACTLRAAIQEANASVADTIDLAPTTYTLTVAGRGDDAAATGDLDITADLTIHGHGATINAAHIDRVVQVMAAATANVSSLTITGGTSTSGTNGTDGGNFFRDPGTPGGPGTSGEDGGGVHNAGALTLTDVSVTGNVTGAGGNGGYGGGEGFVDGNPVHAGGGGTGGDGGRGGGIYNTGTLTLASSTLSGNLNGAGGVGGPGGDVWISMPSGWWSVGGQGGRGGTGGQGGGLFSTGTVSLTNATIGANKTGAFGAAGAGGRGRSAWLGSCEPEFSCWYASNGPAGQPGKSGSGGGIAIDGGIATVTASTITRNIVAVFGSGTGIAVLSGATTIQSSIVANQVIGKDCKGVVTSGGFNLESTTSCAFVAAGDLQNTSANLGPLAANGGPTQTYLPSIGSAAIGAIALGVNGCGTTLSSDQRGVGRPQGSGCDIGAVEQ
jgi:uncharacterized protein YjbI with pentapeptide repeats